MPQPWRQLGEAASAKDDELTYLLRLLRDTARDSSQQVAATESTGLQFDPNIPLIRLVPMAHAVSDFCEENAGKLGN